MTDVFANRIKETTTTQGTGTISLAGASSGFESFVTGIGDGNETYYLITDGVDWEIGIGTVTDASPDTLSRDSVKASSNGDALVNWSAGTRDVFGAVPTAELMNELYEGRASYYADSGAADAYVIAPSPAIQARTAGLTFAVKIGAGNDSTGVSGGPTLNDGIGSQTIINVDGTTVAAGEIQGGGVHLFAWDGTNYQLLNPRRAGDVSGPGSSTDNALPRFDGPGGKTLQGSSVVVDDSNNMSGVANLTATGTPTLGGLAYPTSDGTSGQVLTTNGSGTLSFASVGGSVDATARALAILALMNDDLAAGLNAVAVAYDWSTHTLATATNANNDQTNEAYTNALADSATDASPVSTGGFGNAIFVDRSFSLENGGLVDKLGFASNTGASNYDLYILERIGTEDYTPRAKIANATHTGGGALEYFDLAADYRVPGTGDFYVGIDVKSNATQGATSASTFARATRSTGSLTVDTNYNSGWTEGTNKVIVCGAQYVTGNMTLVPSAVTLDTADPDDVSLWTIVDILDGGDPEADVQCRFTLNDGSNWTTAAVADSVQPMPGGTDKYLLRFDGDLSALSGSSFKPEITTLNSEGVSVEEPIAVPLY